MLKLAKADYSGGWLQWGFVAGQSDGTPNIIRKSGKYSQGAGWVSVGGKLLRGNTEAKRILAKLRMITY